MGLFDKLFGGKKQQQPTAVAEPLVECPHAVLVPRWDSVQDMGHEDKATRYMCESCREVFTPEQAAQLRDSIAERMTAALEEMQEASAEAEAAETTEQKES
jgi:hypothetical protein